VVRPRQGTVYLCRHQQREDQILLHDFAAGPLVSHGGRGHHHLSAGTRPLNHAEDRAGEQAVPLERATHPPASYGRGDGRSQAVPMSEERQEPRLRSARRLPPQRLVWPATQTYRPFSPAIPRATWTPATASSRPQLSWCSRALSQSPTAQHFCSASRNYQNKWKHSVPRGSALAPPPGTAVRAADPPPEMTLHPPPACKVAAMETGRKV
jgi:hypothetical protein